MSERPPRPLNSNEELKLYRSITAALTRLVQAREDWILYVLERGACYCGNPFWAHQDNAERWSRFHLGCVMHWPWRGDGANPTHEPATPADRSEETATDSISVDRGAK